MSTYCDLPRGINLANRLALSEHIIDAFSRTLGNRVVINSTAWRVEGNHWGAYVYATIQMYDINGAPTSRGIRFRVTDTFIGIQGGSARAPRFAKGPPPANAPLCPAADTPQLAELNLVLKRVGTPIASAARTDTPEARELLNPETSRLGALEAAQHGERSRSYPVYSDYDTIPSAHNLRRIYLCDLPALGWGRDGAISGQPRRNRTTDRQLQIHLPHSACIPDLRRPA